MQAASSTSPLLGSPQPSNMARYSLKPEMTVDRVDICMLTKFQAHYADLVKVFGEPMRHATGEKVQVEWSLVFHDAGTGQAVLASIFDWLEFDTLPEDITEWALSGTDIRALWAVSNHMMQRHADLVH